MKPVFIAALILLFLSSNAQLNKADSLVNACLNFMDKVIKDPNSDPSGRRSYVISFLENLTGIASESDLSFAGKWAPEINAEGYVFEHVLKA